MAMAKLLRIAEFDEALAVAREWVRKLLPTERMVVAGRDTILNRRVPCAVILTAYTLLSPRPGTTLTAIKAIIVANVVGFSRPLSVETIIDESDSCQSSPA